MFFSKMVIVGEFFRGFGKTSEVFTHPIILEIVRVVGGKEGKGSSTTTFISISLEQGWCSYHDPFKSCILCCKNLDIV